MSIVSRVALAALALSCAFAQNQPVPNQTPVPATGSIVGITLANTNPSGVCVLASSQQFNYLTGHMWGCAGALGSMVWTDLTSVGGGTVTGATLNGSAITLSGSILQFQLPNIGATGLGVNAAASGSGNSQLDTLYTVDSIDAQTGTSYPIPATDCGGTVQSNNASAVAWALPQAAFGSTNGVANFYSGCRLRLVNIGAGAITVTPSTSTIAGNATLTIPAGTATNPKFAVIQSDGTNYSLTDNNLTAAASGPSVTSGTYAARPATCTTNDLYIYTTGAYTLSRCTATNTWTTFLNGYPVTVPAEMTIGSNSWNRTTGVTISPALGFESITAVGDATGGGNSTMRYWTAPGTPYTKYLFFNTPAQNDQSAYRTFEAGFEDSTGARLGLDCGVAAAQASGYWCKVQSVASTGNSGYADQVSLSNTFFGYLFDGRQSIIGLQDDGTNIHIQACSAPGSCYEIYNAARTAVLGTPTRLYYGLANTGTAAITNSIQFLGQY